MSKVLEDPMVTEKKSPKEKTNYELTQQKLADIYFSATGKSGKAESPVIIKVVENPRWASVVPWVITSFAFLITAFSLFSTKRIFVDIKVLDEKTPYQLVSDDYAREPQPQPKPSPIIPAPIETSGEMVPFDNFIFEGAARLKSSKSKAGLMLVNSSLAPFARANLYFSKPIDLSSAKIVFSAKGQKGGENVAFAIKDEANVLAFDKGKVYPFPYGLTTRWQKAEVLLTEAMPTFDHKSVQSLRFDFGSKDTENRAGDIVFIRDLQIVHLEKR